MDDHAKTLFRRSVARQLAAARTRAKLSLRDVSAAGFPLSPAWLSRAEDAQLPIAMEQFVHLCQVLGIAPGLVVQQAMRDALRTTTRKEGAT